MGARKHWKNAYEYRRILEILDDYWLTEKDERFVRVEMYFEKGDGQTQEKMIVWHNPNMRSSILGDGRHVSEERLTERVKRLPHLISAAQIVRMGDMPFKEYVMLKYGRDPDYDYNKEEFYVDDPLGDFAHDLAIDDHFPIYDYGRIYGDKWHHDKLRDYIRLNCHGNYDVLDVFEKCYQEWENRYRDDETYEKAKERDGK